MNDRGDLRDEPQRGEHQNIARIALVLSTLAKAGNDGLRLTSVVRLTGLSKTAVHRCLTGLVAHGMASFDQPAALYFLGDRVLGWAHEAHGRFELAERVIPHLEHLAEATGDTAYFMLRRNYDMVCYGRVLGSYPVTMLSLGVGGSRPIGIGAGGLALLGALPPEEVEEILGQHLDAYKEVRISIRQLRQQIAEARARGFAHGEGPLVAGMAGIGVAVKEPNGYPVGTLSVSAISARLAPPREKTIADLLKTEARRLESKLSSLLARCRVAPGSGTHA